MTTKSSSGIAHIILQIHLCPAQPATSKVHTITKKLDILQRNPSLATASLVAIHKSLTPTRRTDKNAKIIIYAEALDLPIFPPSAQINIAQSTTDKMSFPQSVKNIQNSPKAETLHSYYVMR